MNNENGNDLVWEAAGIANVISRTERQVLHMLNTGQIPAKKVGGRWVASRAKLIAYLTNEAA